jgi:CMP-N,N'-diacetyllegionaminic acid synthase
MLLGQRILVVVPARGGSKGIPLKNIVPVAGRPLIAWTADTVHALDWVDRAVVSTDHLVIRQGALDAGLDAPFMRPAELSGDRIGDLDVLTHALHATEADDGERYDVIVMLQPTSPLRRPAHVTDTVRKLIEGGFDAVWTVTATDLKAHPLKQLNVAPDGRMDYYDARGAAIIARQQLTPVYHRNGVAYALTRACLLDQQSLMGRHAGAVVIEEPLVNIDTEQDLARADALLRRDTVLSPPSVPAPAVRPRRLVIDVDGVIASAVPDLDYAQATPIADNVNRINALYDAGCNIVVYTARGSATGKDWSDVTRSQLAAWGLHYHELRFGKPPADFYIDDRALTLHQALALCGLDDPANKPVDGEA